MSAAPEVPQFDRSTFPQAPWLSKLWEALLPFFQRTSSALKAGLSHGYVGDGYQPGNLRGFYRELRVPAGVKFPLTFRNELPNPAKGVVLWAARLEARPEEAINAAVRVDWQNATEAGSGVVRIRALPGLDPNVAYVVTLAVYDG